MASYAKEYALASSYCRGLTLEELLKLHAHRGWLGLTAVVAGLMGVAVGILPGLTTVFLIAVATCVLLYIKPKIGLLISGLVVLFSPTVAILWGMESFDYSDEISIGLVTVIAVLRSARSGSRLHAFPGQWFFAGFLLLGSVSSYVASVDLSVFVGGLLLASKGALFAFAVVQVDWTARDLRRLAFIGAAVSGVVIVSLCLNALVGSSWTTSLQGYVDNRYGYDSLVGIFVHPLALGNLCAVLLVGIVAWRAVFGRSLISDVLMTGVAAGIVLSLRRTAVSAALGGLALVRLRVSAASTAVVATVGVLIGGVAYWSVLSEVYSRTYSEYITGGGSAARVLLTEGAFTVAHSHLPLGAGFGRYGSYPAAQYYSPEYARLGFGNIWGVSSRTGEGAFLTDTAWPAVIGEAGYFGATLFTVGILMLWRSLWALQKRAGELRWLGLSGLGAIVVLFISSVGIPVFTGPPYYVILFGVAGLCGSVSRGVVVDVATVVPWPTGGAGQGRGKVVT